MFWSIFVQTLILIVLIMIVGFFAERIVRRGMGADEPENES